MAAVNPLDDGITLGRRDLDVLMVLGTSAQNFVDGLSTNLVPSESGQAIRTCFTDRAARILGTAYLLTREEGVVLVVHRMWTEALLEHLASKRLGQPLEFRNLSDRNHVCFVLNPTTDLPIGTWRVEGTATVARVHDALLLSIAPGPMPASIDDASAAWTHWRVKHRWPEDGAEVTSDRHPLACGLEGTVHPNKGCYLGQEVLTRMRSRNKSGWLLKQGLVDEFDPTTITSESNGWALAIVRQTIQ